MFFFLSQSAVSDLFSFIHIYELSSTLANLFFQKKKKIIISELNLYITYISVN